MHTDRQTGHADVSPLIVFVAPEEIVATWSAGAGASGDALAFTDDDAHRALETIVSRRPRVVVLDQLFAASAHGAAFVYRLQTEPSLREMDIRVLSRDRFGALASTPSSSRGYPSLVALAHPIERGPIRRAARMKLSPAVETLVDGHAAQIIDLSIMGAQMVSPTVLRPNQRVRILLPDTNAAVRLQAAIAWAAFERPDLANSPVYRVGLQFIDPDPQALESFFARVSRTER